MRTKTGTLVREAMTRNPRTVDPQLPVIEAARIMLQEELGSVPVTEGNRLIGMLTDRDIVIRVVAEGKDTGATPVAGVATRQLVTARPEQPLEEALELMAHHRVRRLPVVEDDRELVGVVAQADVALAGDEKAAGEVVAAISQPDGSER